MDNKTEHISNKSSKIFWLVFFLLILGSVSITFYRIIILKDYQIVAEVSCDPAHEKCFIHECDPTAEECSNNPAENISYYKKISKKAATIAACDNTQDKIGCDGELSCTDGEKNCSYTYCDPNNLPEGGTCSE